MATSMRVIDTSAWIEWLVDSASGRKLSKEFPDKSGCIVPTIVQLELSKWLVREVGEDRIRQRNPLGRFCAAKCRRSFAVESTKRASDHRCH
jgi:uncharacterized protein with PIN domain